MDQILKYVAECFVCQNGQCDLKLRRVSVTSSANPIHTITASLIWCRPRDAQPNAAQEAPSSPSLLVEQPLSSTSPQDFSSDDDMSNHSTAWQYRTMPELANQMFYPASVRTLWACRPPNSPNSPVPRTQHQASNRTHFQQSMPLGKRFSHEAVLRTLAPSSMSSSSSESDLASFRGQHQAVRKHLRSLAVNRAHDLNNIPTSTKDFKTPNPSRASLLPESQPQCIESLGSNTLQQMEHDASVSDSKHMDAKLHSAEAEPRQVHVTNTMTSSQASYLESKLVKSSATCKDTLILSLQTEVLSLRKARAADAKESAATIQAFERDAEQSSAMIRELNDLVAKQLAQLSQQSNAFAAEIIALHAHADAASRQDGLQVSGARVSNELLSQQAPTKAQPSANLAEAHSMLQLTYSHDLPSIATAKAIADDSTCLSQPVDPNALQAVPPAFGTSGSHSKSCVELPRSLSSAAVSVRPTDFPCCQECSLEQPPMDVTLLEACSSLTGTQTSTCVAATTFSSEIQKAELHKVPLSISTSHSQPLKCEQSALNELSGLLASLRADLTALVRDSSPLVSAFTDDSQLIGSGDGVVDAHACVELVHSLGQHLHALYERDMHLMHQMEEYTDMSTRQADQEAQLQTTKLVDLTGQVQCYIKELGIEFDRVASWKSGYTSLAAGIALVAANLATAHSITPETSPTIEALIVERTRASLASQLASISLEPNDSEAGTLDRPDPGPWCLVLMEIEAHIKAVSEAARATCIKETDAVLPSSKLASAIKLLVLSMQYNDRTISEAAMCAASVNVCAERISTELKKHTTACIQDVSRNCDSSAQLNTSLAEQEASGKVSTSVIQANKLRWNSVLQERTRQFEQFVEDISTIDEKLKERADKLEEQLAAANAVSATHYQLSEKAGFRVLELESILRDRDVALAAMEASLCTAQAEGANLREMLLRASQDAVDTDNHVNALTAALAAVEELCAELKQQLQAAEAEARALHVESKVLVDEHAAAEKYNTVKLQQQDAAHMAASQALCGQLAVAEAVAETQREFSVKLALQNDALKLQLEQTHASVEAISMQMQLALLHEETTDTEPPSLAVSGSLNLNDVSFSSNALFESDMALHDETAARLSSEQVMTRAIVLPRSGSTRTATSMSRLPSLPRDVPAAGTHSSTLSKSNTSRLPSPLARSLSKSKIVKGNTTQPPPSTLQASQDAARCVSRVVSVLASLRNRATCADEELLLSAQRENAAAAEAALLRCEVTRLECLLRDVEIRECNANSQLQVLEASLLTRSNEFDCSIARLARDLAAKEVELANLSAVGEKLAFALALEQQCRADSEMAAAAASAVSDTRMQTMQAMFQDMASCWRATQTDSTLESLCMLETAADVTEVRMVAALPHAFVCLYFVALSRFLELNIHELSSVGFSLFECTASNA